MSNLFLMAPPQGTEGAGNPLVALLPWVLIFVVIYFFMIRPQNKKAKDQKLFRENIAKGDRIVTIGGVHGKIIELGDTTVIIEVEGQMRLKIEKTAISQENTLIAYPPDKK
ncbi:MAG: preprotein translocase subunit YajC [Sphingobacteriaceae bacterium]|nr:preprotein translocase subunit YajC [Sphingobacteriaceae bacterium]